MHELAIAESVVSQVLERTHDRHVSVVRLRVGRLAGVVPQALEFCFELASGGADRAPGAPALEFCFELASGGTPLAGASLEIVEAGGVARCRSCGTDFELVDPILLC